MKKVLLFLVNGLICLFITNVSVAQKAFQQGTDPDKLVVIEAENFHENIPGTAVDVGGEMITHEFIKIDTTPGFSGTGSMISWPDVGVNNGDVAWAQDNSARLKYRVNFVTTGPHYIWIRAHGNYKGGGSRSYHVGFGDTITIPRMEIIANPPVFEWRSHAAGPITPVVVDIPTVGEHTFSIYMRQDGAQIDKIIFTTNDQYEWSLPVGSLGPDESPQVGGENEAPVVDSPLGDLTLDEGFGSETIDLTGVFSDPDQGDELTLSVTSSDETVVTASIDGASLIITEVGLGSSTVTVTATDNGTPELSVSDSFTVTINEIVGISPINDNNKYSISIYPNPSYGNTHLNFGSNKVEDVDITIFNFVGQKLISKSYKSIPLTNGIDLPTQSLEKGIYLIQCKIAGQTQTIKLIKE